MKMFSQKKLLLFLLVVLAIASAVMLFLQFSTIIIAETGGSRAAPMYIVVARGILNGLTPYVDLFESKPLGIFFISVLSLLLTGDEQFALYLQAAMLLTLPILFGVFAWKESQKQKDRIWRTVLIATGFSLGTLLSLYIAVRVEDGFQTEAIGAFFASLYLLNIARSSFRFTRVSLLINALLLIGTFGLKEPFILTVIAGAVLITSAWKERMRVFVYPVLLAGCIWAAVLGVVGYLVPYFFTYLPPMLIRKDLLGIAEPLWVRGLAVMRLWDNFTLSLTLPLLAGIFFILLLAVPWLKERTLSPLRGSIAAGTILLVNVCAMLLATVLSPRELQDVLRHLPFLSQNILLILSSVLFLALIIAGWYLFRKEKKLLGEVTLVCVALYLTMVAVSVGQYASQHWVFAAPMLTALGILCIRYNAKSQSRYGLTLLALLCTVAGFCYRPDEAWMKDLQNLRSFHSSNTAATAESFDALLDSCSVETYFMHDTGLLLIYTKHSPIGPMFLLRENWYLTAENPLYQQTLQNIRENAEIIVIGTGSTDMPGMPAVPGSEEWKRNFLTLLRQDFTREKPACAREIPPLNGLEIFFRKTILQ